MSIAGYNSRFTTVNSSVTADMPIPVFVAPKGGAKLVTAYAFSSTTLAAGSANHFNFSLLNGGTAGTALTAISGFLGGTAASGTAPGWTAQKKETFTLTSGSEKLTEGQVLLVKYDETGTVAIGDWTVIVEWTQGI
jgi:hypothetical protein